MIRTPTYIFAFLAVCLLQVSAQPDFYTETAESILMVDDRSDEPAILPCTLRYNPGNTNDGAIDLLWSENVNGGLDYVYLWNEDDGVGKTLRPRFSGINPNATKADADRFYLKISSPEIGDEGKYCCDLNYNTNPSRVNCTDFSYKLIPIMNITCDTRNPTMTENITVSVANPAILKAEFTDFYPRDGRVFQLYDNDNAATALASSTDAEFTSNENGNGTFNAVINLRIEEPGTYLFKALLSSENSNSDEAAQRCHYIPPPPPPPDPPTTTEQTTTTTTTTTEQTPTTPATTTVTEHTPTTSETTEVETPGTEAELCESWRRLVLILSIALGVAIVIIVILITVIVVLYGKRKKGDEEKGPLVKDDQKHGNDPTNEKEKDVNPERDEQNCDGKTVKGRNGGEHLNQTAL